MALVIDNEPLSPTCNSYASAAEMGAYIAERVPDPAVAVAWGALTPEQQAMYLVNATRTLNSLAEWYGDRYYNYPYQQLDHPRYNLYVGGQSVNTNTTEFLQPLIEATCEMAIWAMQQAGVVAQAQNLAFDSIKLGPITIDFNESAGGTLNKYFPDIVAIILKDLATMNNPDLPGANRLKVAKVHRA